jgi:hypothetical protein
MAGGAVPCAPIPVPTRGWQGTASPTGRTLCIWIFPEIPLTRDCGLSGAPCRLPAEY